jgi:hypothetical protein
MTLINVAFRFGAQPTEAQTRLASVRDVYGIWRMSLDAEQRTLRIEYDASRVSETHDRWLAPECRNRLARESGADLSGAVTG